MLALPLKSKAGKPNVVCWEHLCDPKIEESSILAPAGYRWAAALERALAAAADPALVAEAVAWDQARLEAEKEFEPAPAPSARLAAAALLAGADAFAALPRAAEEPGTPGLDALGAGLDSPALGAPMAVGPGAALGVKRERGDADALPVEACRSKRLRTRLARLVELKPAPEPAIPLEEAQLDLAALGAEARAGEPWPACDDLADAMRLFCEQTSLRLPDAFDDNPLFAF